MATQTESNSIPTHLPCPTCDGDGTVELSDKEFEKIRPFLEAGLHSYPDGEELQTMNPCPDCGNSSLPLPQDYEACGDCGFDHSYDYEAAIKWHRDHPCSYCRYDHAHQQHEASCSVHGSH